MQDLVFCMFKKFSVINDSEYSLLDAGCGTGGMLRSLKKFFPRLSLLGIDYSLVALNYCNNNFPAFQASVDSLPFSKESMDTVVCLDVLYHLNVESDLIALKEINRVLKKDGYAFIHLPAFEFLRGNHDKIVFTRERYTIKKLNNRMHEAGFKVIKSSYRHAALFPVICAKRIMENRLFNNMAASDLKPMLYLINGVLKIISCCENRVLKHINLPFGSSVFCLAQKS